MYVNYDIGIVNFGCIQIKGWVGDGGEEAYELKIYIFLKQQVIKFFFISFPLSSFPVEAKQDHGIKRSESLFYQ